MLTSPEKVSSESSIAQFDVSPVVPLRQRISRAATSLKIIGFLSGFDLLVSSYFGFVASLLCAMLIPGLANSTAKRLRSGDVRAAAVAAVWWLWFAFFAFDAFPKSPKTDFDVFTIVGALVILLPLFFLAWGLIALIRYRPAEATGGDADLLAQPWEEGLRTKVRPRFHHMQGAAVLFLILSPLPFLFLWASGLTQDVQFTSDIGEQVGILLGGWLVLFVPAYWGVRIYRRARREAMLPGSALIKKGH